MNKAESVMRVMRGVDAAGAPCLHTQRMMQIAPVRHLAGTAQQHLFHRPGAVDDASKTAGQGTFSVTPIAEMRNMGVSAT